ncbi:DEAD/DEAH box helicase family protein [Nonomuraea typhae]|uniref:DEAD/DEAH box helicase family protein n=1 Tax=Nonomuraea typhae TaxID=2603600 RepID=UPI0012F80555|nr:DEAD/DEAH box helicase family protein [Nonomuraea typhae]
MLRFAGLAVPKPLRRHQQRALAELAAAFAAGRRRAWVVLPPGAGKTLTGLEAARRLGAPIVVFGPNTAIQGQWLAEWHGYGAAARAGTSRALEADVTVLTYQALASFDPDAEIDEEGGERPSHLDRLRPQGRELVARLAALGEVTLLLDECHHLLDTWGELLAEVLRQLPDAYVIGLTATPPDRLTPAQAGLVGELFGPVVRGPSIPAVVREGHLAPYAELAWLTCPTAHEQAWLAAEAERFTELTTDLLDPGFATVGFLEWLDKRLVERGGDTMTWQRLERQEPALAAAALRLHHAGLLPLPEGARVREEHRHRPAAGDWVCLLDDYVRRCLRRSGEPADAAAVEAIRRALPSIGYQLTARGVRAGRTPVDRVVARSEAKTAAVAEILAAEHDALGERLRALVLCDHERATATLPARLSGVLHAQAGSARLVLETLAADPRTARLNPMLVTGRTVAAPAVTAAAFAAFCAGSARLDPIAPGAGGVVELTGAWTSRAWVALATRFLESGGCSILVGTRAMLGEGWDAKGVNTVVDLTEATTPGAVVQLRGRALRADPSWPEKVANTWSVVCVSAEHPKGNADWERFVRKHDGYFGLTDSGTIAAGVAHVHPELSPYAPPPVSGFDRFNVAMLERAADRARVRALWRVGTPYEDRPVHTLRVEAATGPAAAHADWAAPPPAVPAEHGISPRPRLAGRPHRLAGLAGWAAGTGAWLAASGTLEALPLGALGGLPAAALAFLLVRRRRRGTAGEAALREAAGRFDLAAIACAVADGLHAAGKLPEGAPAVRVEPDGTGAYWIELAGVPEDASRLFTLALDEVLAPPVAPRYLVPRYLVTPGRREGRLLMAGRPEPNPVVHHAVPEALGERRKDAETFARAWNRWVSLGAPVYARSPEGAGLLAAQAGGSPLDVATALRLTWR